jgi:glycosyltransferase involved in cell wall biosynthesis
VAVSENVKEKLAQQCNQEVRFRTIPVGLETSFASKPRQKAALPLRLIYAGRISPEKNLQGLLRVLSALHDTSLRFEMTIVGDGRGLGEVRAQAARLPFASQLNFTGSRTPAEVARLLERHDFLLLTSHYEGTPHVVIEAMAHGLVVLASRLPGATDRIITHGIDGFLCDCNTPEEYVEVLRRVSVAPAEFAIVSAAAHHSAFSRYSADVLAAQYEALFDSPDRKHRRSAQPFMNGPTTIPETLFSDLPGIVRQCKHRIADFCRALAHGQRRVSG